MTSPLNSVYASPAVIRPRLRVLVSGQSIPTALSTSITSTNNYHGDRYTAVLAPPLSGYGSFAWWEQQTDIAADVQIGLVPPGAPESAVVWQSIVQGPVDRISCGFNAGAVRIEGRDYTALLIDFKTEMANVNRTSSEIVAALAAQVGLQSQVMQTTTPVGRYYELEHAGVQLNQFHRAITGWDEVVLLARYEGFDAFFVGDTLFFQPPVAAGSDPYLLWWQQDSVGRISSNALEFSADRVLTVAKGVNVIVKSWHGKQARAFSRGYPSAKPVGTNSKVQQYVFVRPNLTEDQAQRLANQLYAEIIRHERIIRAALPGDAVLTPRVLVQVTGTGTGYDQMYYPDTITRTVDSHSGYVMRLSAKNHSPQTEVAAP